MRHGLRIVRLRPDARALRIVDGAQVDDPPIATDGDVVDVDQFQALVGGTGHLHQLVGSVIGKGSLFV